MITGHIYIARSLDGYIAREDGSLDWLTEQAIEGENLGYEEFTLSMDVLILGRHTYEKVLSFGEWPYKLPVVVMSNTLKHSDLKENLIGKVKIWQGSPKTLMAQLALEGSKKAYVDGGQLIQSFLQQGLIKDMNITTAPILLGKGISLFGARNGEISMTHVSSTSFPSGYVQSKYEVKKSV